ncbi:MAG: RIP metalloprotease RseP, partial [Rhodothermales bacterium]|nr:RIP metalloprotease RseP [Rhodothermales bacterium]
MLAIMILVFVHEMGHFLFAKLFGMRVDRFSVGFPPNLFLKKFRGTEYVLGATPLGGYVKISGMVDESMDTDFVSSDPEPWEFRSKPVWQRIIVITAGVVFNVLLAAIIFMTLKYTGGETYIPAENIEAVYIEDDSFLHDLGLRTGDRIVAVNGEPMERADDFLGLDALIANRLTITVQRGSETVTLEGPDDLMTQLNRSQGNFGISYNPAIIGGVAGDSPAAGIGLRAGDRILSVDSQQVGFWNQLTALIRESDGRQLQITWHRPDSMFDEASLASGVAVVARRGDGVVLESKVAGREVAFEGEEYFGLGIRGPSVQQLQRELGFEVKHYTLAEAVTAGVDETWVTTKA